MSIHNLTPSTGMKNPIAVSKSQELSSLLQCSLPHCQSVARKACICDDSLSFCEEHFAVHNGEVHNASRPIQSKSNLFLNVSSSSESEWNQKDIRGTLSKVKSPKMPVSKVFDLIKIKKLHTSCPPGQFERVNNLNVHKESGAGLSPDKNGDSIERLSRKAYNEQSPIKNVRGNFENFNDNTQNQSIVMNSSERKIQEMLETRAMSQNQLNISEMSPADIHGHLGKEENVPDIISVITYEEAKDILDSLNLEEKKNKKKSCIFGCGGSNKKQNPGTSDPVNRVFLFGEIPFQCGEVFHSNLLESFMDKNGLSGQYTLDKPVRKLTDDIPLIISVQKKYSLLSLFLFLYLDRHYPSKIKRIQNYTGQKNYYCPFMLALINVTTLFVSLTQNKKINNELFRESRDVKVVLLLYAGLVFRWFDTFFDDRARWSDCNVVNKSITKYALNNWQSLIAVAKQYQV